MKKLIALAGLSIFFTGCYNDKYDKLYPAPSNVTCDTTNVSYTHDIVPILTTYCNVSGGCHDAAGGATSGFDFSTYEGIQSVAVPGDLLLGDINWAPGHNKMPKNGSKLPQCDIDKITRWVHQGAPNN